ncbi:MAG: cupredoxin domain-containing protein [Patescibacteria group bacterium]
MDKYIITFGGVGLVGLIYWFFFGKKEESQANEKTDDNTLIVEGGYKPAVIYVEKDKPKDLTVIRRDPNSCLEEIVFPDYKIKKYLPLNKEVKITLNLPHKEGDFHCGMNMFFGKVRIKK